MTYINDTHAEDRLLMALLRNHTETFPWSAFVPAVRDILREEHRNMSRLLDVLEHRIDMFAVAGDPDFDIVRGTADYFLEYPQLCHHPKEDVIFRRLKERCPHDVAALPNLESEHREVNQRAGRLHETITALLEETDIARDLVVDTARIFIEAERRHMTMEEDQFFPLAEDRLTAEDWSQIANDLNEAHDPLFGDRVETEFSTLSERLLRWEEEDRSC